MVRSLRADHSALTRRRILDAAGRLFAERGYLGATLAEVAAAAGVSVQTLYNSIGSKATLLKAVYDVTLAGDDEPVPMRERPIPRGCGGGDGRECLAATPRSAGSSVSAPYRW